MTDMGEARRSARDAVVRPLSRVAGRPCARPGCPSPARATLSFRYATREAWLERLHDEPSPATYDLCGSHADRTRPPTGWGIVDERPAEDVEPAEQPAGRELGDEHTVAVLAAALRAVPDRAAAPAAPAAPTREPGVDLPEDVRDGIEDALAELAAVSRGEPDGAEQIAIELDVAPHDVPPRDVAHGAASDDVPIPAPAGAAIPRPVRAARERVAEDDPGDPARAW